MSTVQIGSVGEGLAEAAIRFIGCQFRLHGRDPRFGLDCVGLVYASLQAIGRQPVLPNGYRLRNPSFSRFTKFASLNGFHPLQGPVGRGDLLLSCPGPGQFHLMISDGPAGVIHAHAGLRRIVRSPPPDSLHIIERWRLANS